MKIINSIVYFVQRAYGDIPADLTRTTVQRGADPDQLIASAVAHSIAANFEDWKFCKKEYKYVDVPHPRIKGRTTQEYIEAFTEFNLANTKELLENGRYIYNLSSERVYLRNEKKDTTVMVHVDDPSRDYKPTNYTVNDVPLPLNLGDYILDSYRKMVEAHERVERLKREAKEAEELAEKKWQVAEKLLGMKRNDQGALVPVVEVDENEKPMPKVERNTNDLDEYFPKVERVKLVMDGVSF